MRVNRLMLVILSTTLSATAVAEEGKHGADEEAAVVQPLPDGFLEFLGMMVEQEGELIDPLSFDSPRQDREPGATAADDRQKEAERVDGVAETTDVQTAEERR